MGIKHILFVFIGGGLGSVVRFTISWLLNLQGALSLPWATLTANFTSVIVFLSAYYFSGLKPQVTDAVRYFVLIGFCGGLSTFSTFSFETAELFKRGETLWATTNILFNNLLCITMIVLFYSKVRN